MSDAKRWTKTEKKRGNIGNKGACRERGTGNRVPIWGTRSKVDLKNPKAKILNDDLSSKTNPRVKFEKNFRRAVSQPHFGRSGRMKLPLPKLGIWSPPGLPNV